MRKIIFSAILFISTLAFGQSINQKFFTELYSIPISDSVSNYFYFYKIPANNLIFIKKLESYFADLQIAIEIRDSNSNFIQREFKERYITYDDFELTVSPGQFIEGVISFSLENRTSIVVTSRIIDNNSQKEIFTKDETILQNQAKDLGFLSPIILDEKFILCGGSTSKILTNYGGFIPYSNNSNEILIPSTDVSVGKIFVKIISIKDTIFNGIVNKLEVTRIGFTECNDRIIMHNDSNSVLTSNYYISDVTAKLKEGPFEILVSNQDDFLIKKSFKSVVRWFDKPKSLIDHESAIRHLRFIVGEDSIRKLLKSSDDYDRTLHQFWRKFDPSPETEFNELMAEYYNRIDFCLENFSTITGLKGTETDRAKIYILNGKPDSIERSSNNKGKISETWRYTKSQIIFVFVDEKGTGEFVLKSSQ